MVERDNKEPLPTTETASSSSRISKKSESARRQQIHQKAEKRREQLVRCFSGLSGIVYTAPWRKIIGDSGYPLLNILAIGANWRGECVWRGNIGELAELMGVSDKTVRNQLHKLKQIEGFRVVRYPYSIAVYIPDRLISPNAQEGRKKYEQK